MYKTILSMMMIMFYIAKQRSVLNYEYISRGFVHYFSKRCLM